MPPPKSVIHFASRIRRVRSSRARVSWRFARGDCADIASRGAASLASTSRARGRDARRGRVGRRSRGRDGRRPRGREVGRASRVELARVAGGREVPVGAVLVDEGTGGWWRGGGPARARDGDPTAHAEMR